MFFLVVLFFNLRSDKQVDFSTQVKPILNKHCISCHGGVKKTAGFSVLFESEAKGITHSGKPSIIPGNAKESEFIKRLHYTDPERRMPYHKSSLTKNEISILTDWVNQGANWGTHWAYLPVIKTKLPKISSVFEEKNFESNPIDYFVAARMEEVNILPNFSAPKNIIARRLAFDITGLPPDSNLFKSFIKGEINYENYVDQLFLDSAFGEKWASWWLDLAR